MQLKKMEILGCVAGFIPGLSTITGVIKAYIYYKRVKPAQPKRAEVDATANKVSAAKAVSDSKIQRLKEEERDNNAMLWLASVFEIIPVVNMFAAIFETELLSDLKKTRELRAHPEKHSAKLKSDYRIASIEDPQTAAFMNKVLFQIHNLKLPHNLPSRDKYHRYLTLKRGGIELVQHKHPLYDFPVKQKLYSLCYEKLDQEPNAKERPSIELVKMGLDVIIQDKEKEIADLQKFYKDRVVNSVGPGLVSDNWYWYAEKWQLEFNAHNDTLNAMKALVKTL